MVHAYKYSSASDFVPYIELAKANHIYSRTHSPILPAISPRLLISLLIQFFPKVAYFFRQKVGFNMMKLSMSVCHQPRLGLDIPTSRHKLDRLMGPNLMWEKEKVLVIMGATGAGKSRLSIDLATQFRPAEIINSDKIQAYEGLDIVTNKITEEEKSGIPHHLLGFLDPNDDFTATDFCDKASEAIRSISRRESLPIIVGGSNTYIEAFLDNYRFQMDYEFCLLWVDVAMPVLDESLLRRVDKMVKNGMVEEVRNIYDPEADYTRGIRRAIGVPEFDTYLRTEQILDKKDRARLLCEAISEIKNNNCKLARRQVEKIRRLKNIKKWNIHRLDATEVFRRRGKEADEAWERLVARPSAAIVGHFLYSAISSQVPANASPTTQEYIAQCALVTK